MESYVVLFSFCLSSCFWVHVFTQSCIPPLGSTPVYDACATQPLGTLVRYANLTSISSAITANALYSSVGTFSVADLLNLRLPVVPVASNVQFYGGALGEQNVTVVDALTVDLKLSAFANTTVTGDISQLLAAAMFNRAADGVYPDVSDPFLGRLDELDNVVSLLTDIDSLLASLIPLVSSIATTINNTYPYIQDIRSFMLDAFFVNVPTTKTFGGTYGSFISSPLGPMLFDAMYITSVNNINGGNTGGFLEYLPLARLLGMPWADPNINPSSVNCTTSGSSVAPTFPFGNLYGAPTVSDIGAIVSGGPGGGSILSVSAIPYQPFQRCAGQSFNSPDVDQRLVKLAPTSMTLAEKTIVVT